MKFPRITRRRTIVLLSAILALPVLLWACVLVVVPTEWARARLVGELERATGRKVGIRSIRLGTLGNLRLGEVSVAEVSTPDDPWLKATEARLDVHLFQMLFGCCSPTEIAVDGLDLRVHRRLDGSLEFAGLLASEPSAGAVETQGQPPSKGSTSVKLAIGGARVVVIDDPSTTRLELTDAQGKATWSGSLAVVESLRGKINGGTIEFAARYDRSSGAPSFEAEAQARGVSIGVGMKSLGLLVPVVTDVGESVDGRLDLNLALRGQGDSLGAIRPGLKGHGSIRLEPIDLSGSKLLDTIDALKQFPRSGRVGSVSSHFAIEGGRISTDDLTIKVGRLPIGLVGWTDFDGRLDYAVKADRLREKLAGKLPPEARAVLGDLKGELADLATLRITGTVDAPHLTTGGEGGQPRELDGDRLREAARRIGDRYLR